MSDERYLDDLSLDDLEGMSSAIAHLAEAGRALHRHGYTPRFYLTPGFPVSMLIDWSMPSLPFGGEVFCPEPEQVPTAPVDEAEGQHTSTLLRRAFAEAALRNNAVTTAADDPIYRGAVFPAETGDSADAMSLTGIDWGGQDFTVTASIEVQADGALIIEHADPVYDEDPELPRTASQSEGTAFVAVSGEGGREGVAAILPANPSVDAAPAPGSASAQAANRPAPWTEDEDAQAVSLYVQGLRLGATQRAAGLNVAHQLARPIEGVLFRLKNKLTHAVEAALQAKAVAADVQNAATPLTPTGELQAYLAGLPRKLGHEDWPLASDLSLIELATQGFGKQDIAVDMGVDAKLIGERFDLLTGQHRDADGKLVRGWKTRDVLAALQALTPARA